MRSLFRTALAVFVVGVAVLGAGAPARAQGDPSADGPYSVREADLTVRHPNGSRSTLQTFVPANRGGRLPTVLIFHGLWVSPSIYESYARNLASRGYVAAMFDQLSRGETDLAAWVDAGRFTIDALVQAGADPSSPLFGRVDPDRIGVMGHSYGGMTAIGLASAEPRVRAAVALAPGAARRELLLRYAATARAPVLVITGERDGLAVPSRFGRPAYEAMPGREKLYLEVDGAGHMSFADSGFFGASARDRTRRASRRYANAWFGRWLEGAADPGGYTDGRFAARDRDLADRAAPAPPPATGTWAGTVTATELNVRRGPSTAYDVVTTLPQGALVTILDERGGWYRVTWDGAPNEELWLSGRYIARARMGTITADFLNIRRGPGINHPIVTTRADGDVVRILGQSGSWYRVSWSGAPDGELWAHGGYIDG